MIHHLKKIILSLLRISISVGLIAYLIWDATQGKGNVNVFTNLRDQPKNWWLFTAAWAVLTAAVLLTFIRWWFLVRALDIPCRFADAMRIGFWGFLFNLAPLGIIGGDLVKAVMLAHEQRRYQAKAVAAVLFDRLVGLYLLFVMASAGILLTGFWRNPVPEIQEICCGTFIITVLGTLGIAAMLITDITQNRLTRLLGKIPWVGQKLESLISAVGLYRHKPLVLLISSLMSAGVHCLFAVGIYLIARGLPGDVFSLGSYFIFWPLSDVTAVLPLPLGPFEFVLEFLYTHISPAGVTIAKGQGLVVALVWRLINLLIAALGVYYYFGNRRELSEAIQESEQVQ